MSSDVAHVVTSYMDMSCDVAHDIVVSSYIDMSSDLAHTTVDTSSDVAHAMVVTLYGYII
jgi:hypothetical protein